MNLAAGQCVYQEQAEDHGREPVGKCLKGCQIIGQRVVETFSSVPSLSRRDLFYDLSTRESCPLRIPLDELGAAVSPADKS
ncbi:MAG: hypothetical protein JRJ69_05430 [Deltaproteobacteria bacterium]|nr:hypothetical protein [Deltaproteobacteria bacterium]MBW2033577.1 hypothetical protein [Deltaproteobacteria bacterium]MBW2114422.1 hypothetical protein [Deltaproteobacteria bacterium]MBW2357660.1 hypothetical protein [Deltaproteobacteria bacterium]